jgi:hypothetical protein
MKEALLRALVVGLMSACLLIPACAKRGAPSGGPPDTTPPYVEEISPSGGAVGVGRGSAIKLTFSERMKTRTVETAVIVSPPCRWEKRYWEGRTYVLAPQAGLREGATYLVSVSNKAEDSHGVKMKSTFVSGFSTGDSLDAGVISGSVRWKTVDVEGALVLLFEANDADTLEAFAGREPLYVTLSGGKGEYRIPFVDMDQRYRVYALIDDDLDSGYDEGEKVGCHLGEVKFWETSEMEDIDVTICGETLSGGIAGVIDTSSVADTLVLAVTARSLGDSSVSYGVRPDKSGRFEIGCVEPGTYSIKVINDLNPNQGQDPEDSILVELPDTVHVDSCEEPPFIEIELDDEG